MSLLIWLLSTALPARSQELTASGPPVVQFAQVVPTKKVAPPYPEAARQLDIESAICRLRIFINEQGLPYDVKVESCPKIFEDVSVAAAWQWTFEPFLVDGVPTRAQFVMSYKFVLENRRKDAEDVFLWLSAGGGLAMQGAHAGPQVALGLDVLNLVPIAAKVRHTEGLLFGLPYPEGAVRTTSAVGGFGTWRGPLRPSLMTGLACDAEGRFLPNVLRVPVDVGLVVRPGDWFAVQVAATPSLVVRGPEARDTEAYFDELELSGAVWVGLRRRDADLLGIQLAADWRRLPTDPYLGLSLGLGRLPPNAGDFHDE